MTALSRRGFLELAGGLAIGFAIPIRSRPWFADAAPTPPPAIDAFLHIGSDSVVTIFLNHSEMGQGVWTGLPMIIADELDADWDKIRVEHAPVAPVYARPGGRGQGTGGSSSTRSELDRLRTVGATARALLIEAAARRWKVPASALHAEAGFVVGPSGRLAFGELADAAAALPRPAHVTLKAPAHWTIIGTERKRLDSPEKITGRAQFGLDVQFPGLLTALVARSPVFGGQVKTFQAQPALKIPGVRKVIVVPSGVAVIADHFWAAKLGRDAVEIDWDLGDGASFDSDRYRESLRALVAGGPGRIVVDKGKVDAALAAATTRVEARYEMPFLAHAPMEPLNATVKIDGERCEIWTGTQAQTTDQAAAAEVLGFRPEDVSIHTMFLGGAFGRRAALGNDFVREAVAVARVANVPVKTVWTREDDMRGGHYRPMFVHRLEGGLDAKGRPVAWRQLIAGQPIGRPGGKPDDSGHEGVSDSPYLTAIPAHHVSLHSPVTPVPVQWWRSVGNSHTAFAMESFIDELAHAGKRDPLDLRHELLKASPQHLRVLEAAADRAGYGTTTPGGIARGIAVHASFGSVVAQVADVSIDNGRIRVHRVVCAVDCGLAVNPNGIVAQMQSAVMYGLSAALHGEIHIKQGRVVESNFHDYPVVRMHEAPLVEVLIMSSKAPIGGIGEPGLPPLAPAVANAVFALTGKRLRTLPFVL